jgi:two-component system response regulator FlrC
LIGLLDLAEQGLVKAALDARGHCTSPLSGPEEAIREVVGGGVEALIVETTSVDARVRELLLATGSHAVPTLVVARDRSVGVAVDTLRAGATDYLAVPFEYESLLRAVDRLIDQSCASAVLHHPSQPFITQDPDTLATLELLRSVAASDATILIEGESGTGKELLAQLVHRASPRRNRELISINCAALPAGLLESELFGHERGAFTGALSRVIGKFELAHGTTILLDEIGELEPSLQAKLLRVIQEKQVQRIGARRPIRVDFRLVTTTNRDLAADVRSGRFREDLFYRLNVLPVRLTPLRERIGDVPLLVQHFAHQHARAGQPSLLFPDDTIEALCQYDWPGNVRELENLLARLALTLGKQLVSPADLAFLSTQPSVPAQTGNTPPPFRTIREMERWLIVQTLTRRMGNRTQAARDLGISLRTLRNKIHEYHIVEPETLPRTGGASSDPAKPAGRPRPASPNRAEAAG